MLKLVSFLWVAAGAVTTVQGHSYHTGKCPIVEPVPGFQMPEFLGLWYAIQETASSSRHLTYNFIATNTSDSTNEYILDLVREHNIFGMASIDKKVHYAGILKTRPETPGKMMIEFLLNPIGAYSFIVFMTDYDSYAGIYSCQKIPLFNRRSVTILSRKKTLEKVVIDQVSVLIYTKERRVTGQVSDEPQIRNRMLEFGLSPSDLRTIDHTELHQYNNLSSSSKTTAGTVKKETGIGTEDEDELYGSDIVYRR